MNDMKTNGGQILFAFLAGAMIGVGMGILIAPRPGKETRKQLADLAQKAQERAGDLAGRMRHRAEEAAGEARGGRGA